MNFKEIRNGAILSYLLIIINTIYGLFFTPFLISSLGSGEYGVYRIIGSLIGSLSILDFGIGTTVIRFIAKFIAEKNKKNLENFCAMSFMQATVLSSMMLVICLVIGVNIDNIYGNSLTAHELSKANTLFSLFVIILVFNTYEKVLFGILSGSERFVFANTIKLIRIILKLVLAILIFIRYADSVVLLLIDIFLLVITMLVQYWYIREKIGINFKYYYWDKELFFTSFKYTLLVFIQSVVVQFNGNLDNMVIGALIGSMAVTIYSIGLQLYNMYEQFALAFSDLMLPSISKQIADGATNNELEDTVIKVGRLEFMALGGALSGYIVLGKEFISLWLGDGYEFSWFVGLVLMIPTTIPLIQNVCLSILRAKNKMFFRTIAVCCMAFINLIITVFGVRYYGPIAACIGTIFGLIGANIIAMNIYYYKILGLNVFRIFRGIFEKTILSCLVAFIALAVINILIHGCWAAFLIKVLAFFIIYFSILYLYGFKDYEREYFNKLLKIY